MSTFAQDFRTFLVAQPAISAAVGTHVHVGSVPQEIAPPYIYLQRARATQERTLDQEQGEIPFEEQWDIEAISADPDQLAAITDAVRGIDCARGVFGAGRMQSIFLEDQADDYIPKGIFSDTGLDVAAWSATVYGYQPGTEPSSESSDSSSSESSS